MIEWFIRVLLALFSNDVSLFFITIIILYWIFAVTKVNSSNPKAKALVLNAAGAMTSLGILGTFIGIFLGLLDFDIRSINSSVPALLEGLKVAFGTSIVGLVGAITYRIISPLIVKESMNKDDATIGDIVEKLSKLNETISLGTEANKLGFETLGKALTDDKDSSIVGQLQRLRTSVGDLESTTRHGFEFQIKEFQDFAKHMSEAFSKAIIEELQAVIREFNETLSEQFGENFKQLNVAVGRLVEWQDEYRQQMSDLKSALDNAVEGIQKTEISLVEIEQSTSKIPAHLSNMEQANSELNTQIEKMSAVLGGFAEMREKAVNAFPEIEKNIENITSNLNSTVEKQTETVKEIGTNFESLMSLQKESNENLHKGFEELRSTTSDTITEQKTAQEGMLKGLETAYNNTVTETTSRMNDSFNQLGESIQKEIQSVVTTMAQNLSGMAEKFVKDYDGLLTQVQKIAELGKKVNKE